MASFKDFHSASSFADSIDPAPWRSKQLEVTTQKPRVSISRTTAMPNDLAVARCHRLPEYGPRILFFSGGSALRQLSETLKNYTHNSIHLITPFDSGGSSAEIRRAFEMLSVGDLRNRLMALSDDSNLRNPNVKELFSYRLSKHEPLLAQSDFRDFLAGRHPLCQAVSLPMRSILSSHLRWFANRMPPDFDLCGASVGNLIITGCFLEHDRDIVTAIYLIWKLLGVKGKVRPLTAANLHLRAHYENGDVEIGQHLLGKHESTKRIVKIDLVEFSALSSSKQTAAASSAEQPPSRTCHIDLVSAELVHSADVLCYPMGSFFGSLLVNLLPIGVGKAIVQRHCPKIYIPNTGQDPEMYGYSLTDCIQRIVDMVRLDVAMANHDKSAKEVEEVPISSILNFVLLDTLHCEYCIEIDADEISRKFGIQVLDLCLVDAETKVTVETMLEKSRELHPVKVVEVLLTLGS
jgi:CofD-related protein of GAK system